MAEQVAHWPDASNMPVCWGGFPPEQPPPETVTIGLKPTAVTCLDCRASEELAQAIRSWDADVRRYTGMDGEMPLPRLKVGVKAAGRLLDGVLHDARPTIGPKRFAFRDERGLRKSINRPR